ncbi:putative methyltransferase NSUN7 isoform X1 [Petromyzon marinus]|uniref:putative methyltransferase NSUN7 isoform X1 n=1 Tax=Petromyzon marinus TaxID=7757 RepID=UPI003F6FBA23
MAMARPGRAVATREASGQEEETEALGHRAGGSEREFAAAAALFGHLRADSPADRAVLQYSGEKRLGEPGLALLHGDSGARRRSYALAFSALKYQTLIEGVLVESGFYSAQLIPDELLPLAVVLFWDLQLRGFEPRDKEEGREAKSGGRHGASGEARSRQEGDGCSGDGVGDDVREVDAALFSFRTRLRASLARGRIRRGALSLDSVLPEPLLRRERRAGAAPLYAWVDGARSSEEEVQRALCDLGFSQVESLGDRQDRVFSRDRQLADLLIFPGQRRSELLDSDIAERSVLVFQDKSRCVGPHAAVRLLGEEGDVAVVGVGSGVAGLHVASLLAARRQSPGDGGGAVPTTITTATTNATANNSVGGGGAAAGCRVLVCAALGGGAGQQPPPPRGTTADNIKFLPEAFLDLQPGDSRLQRVRVILLTPPCSASGFNDPVELVLGEGADLSILRDAVSAEEEEENLAELSTRQTELLSHAMRFPRVQAVVYSTCSLHARENEAVVSAALSRQHNGGGAAAATKVAPFRVAPSPVRLPEEREGPAGDAGFLSFAPSDSLSGGFMAVLRREDTLEPLTAKEILARASSKGLLGERIKKTKTRRPRGPKTPAKRSDTVAKRAAKVSNGAAKARSFGSSLLTNGFPTSRGVLTAQAANGVTANGTPGQSSAQYPAAAAAASSAAKPPTRPPVRTGPLPGMLRAMWPRRERGGAQDAEEEAARRDGGRDRGELVREAVRPKQLLLPSVCISFPGAGGIPAHSGRGLPPIATNSNSAAASFALGFSPAFEPARTPVFATRFARGKTAQGRGTSQQNWPLL